MNKTAVTNLKWPFLKTNKEAHKNSGIYFSRTR